MSDPLDLIDLALNGDYWQGRTNHGSAAAPQADEECVDLNVLIAAGETIPNRLNNRHLVAYIPGPGWVTHCDSTIAEIQIIGADGKPQSVEPKLWSSLVERIPGTHDMRTVCAISFRIRAVE